MNRNEIAWVVIRALGVITLWMFALSLLTLLVYLPTVPILSRCFPGDATKHSEMMMDVTLRISTLSTELIFQGVLSFYLLRKGKFVHKLLLSNIPSA